MVFDFRDWLEVPGSIRGGTSSTGSVRMFLLLFFYYFLEHTEHREPLETLIADFPVELGVIKVILYSIEASYRISVLTLDFGWNLDRVVVGN